MASESALTQVTLSQASAYSVHAIRRRHLQSTFALVLSFLVEKADETILPASYKYIGATLDASPSQLGSITLTRALVQALTSPIGGLLGDRMDRTYLVAFGCILWGAMTAGIGLSRDLTQARCLSAWNGLGLALIIPCVESLLADLYCATIRGRVFGFLFLASNFGATAGGFFATSVGNKRSFRLEGWRIVFLTTASASVFTGVLVLLLASDPRKDHAQGTGGSRTKTCTLLYRSTQKMAKDIWTVLHVRSFQLLVLQGVVGSMPWVALGFHTLYLQLLGFSDMRAAILQALFLLGVSLGSFGGGYIGDLLTRPLSISGRVLAAQFSVLTTFPCMVLVFKVLPTTIAFETNASFGPYMVTLFFTGFLISWSGPNNSAIFAEIVPEHLRSTVYAFDRCFEGALGATAAPLVGLMAEKTFGFSGSLGQSVDGAQAEPHSQSNAHALGKAMLVLLLLPWGFDFFLYFGLYLTANGDCARSRGGIDAHVHTKAGANNGEKGCDQAGNDKIVEPVHC